MTDEDLIARRARLMGPNVPTFYRDPVEIVRGEGVWLWDSAGRRYLDCYNNVAHVGHCHPHVVAAIARQAGMLATHTRYLHRGVLDYLDRLTATFGHGIAQGIMVCTGSEANDVALRMAQAATGRRGIIATDATYHGNTTAVHALSARRTPVGGHPAHLRFVPAPDGLSPAGGSVAAEAARLATTGSDHARFLYAISRGYEALYRQSDGLEGCCLHDVAAAAFLVAPELFTLRSGRITVATGGEHMGMTSQDNADFSRHRTCLEVAAGPVLSWLTGSNIRMLSTSSPKNSMR